MGTFAVAEAGAALDVGRVHNMFEGMEVLAANLGQVRTERLSGPYTVIRSK